MKTWYIYIHKSKTTGKCYVGQTCRDLEKRWGANGIHYTKTNNLKFYNAIKKYGWEDFDHYIIDTCDSLEKAYELEQFYIDKLDTFKNGYNSTLGGAGSKGRPMTEETKKKLISINKGKSSWVKYAPKEKLPMYGKHHSEETKKKIGNANRGRVLSQEAREKMSKSHLGKRGAKRTEETKRKLREQKLGSKNPMYGKHINTNPSSQIPVIQFDAQGNFIKEYESIAQAKRETGIWQISRAIKLKIKAGGFIWEKKN